MYDAIFHFAKSLDNYLKAQDVNVMELSCTSGQAWQDGEGLLNYMKLVIENIFVVIYIVFIGLSLNLKQGWATWTNVHNGYIFDVVINKYFIESDKPLPQLI